jgi:hypothetical protein
MTSRIVALLCIAFVSGFSISGAEPPWVVRFDGTGPVKIGMSLSQLNRVLHENFAVPEDKDDQPCFYVKPASRAGITFMIEDGHISRVDVDDRSLPTAAGIRVGDSEVQAKRVYGSKLKVTPHAYTAPEGHYLTVHSNDGRYGIRFESEKGKIERFYAGTSEAISYIEGCQ